MDRRALFVAKPNPDEAEERVPAQVFASLHRCHRTPWGVASAAQHFCIRPSDVWPLRAEMRMLLLIQEINDCPGPIHDAFP